MSDKIKVYVVSHRNRTNYSMRYRCPMTGKQIDRSTGTSKKREAEKIAAKWEAELQEGRYKPVSKVTWEEFKAEHNEHVLCNMKAGTAIAYESTINVFERLCNPERLADVTTSRVTAFATILRKEGRTVATIARHLRHLKAIMRWANRQGYLHELPMFDMPKQTKGMKGRPITLEEFERMLIATPKIVGERAADSWRFYLRGLWTSGLRLTESLLLRWDDVPSAIVVELSGRRPMLRIPAESEKGGTHRLLAMAPELAELLNSIPEDERHGWVFRPLSHTGELLARSRHSVGPRVSEIGKKAGIVTGEKVTKGKPEKQHASAHDLRRSFGFRWSRRVMPAVLRELMRHESIETTMKYYVGVNAESTADELWRAVGDKLGDKSDERKNAGSENPII